MAEASCCLWAAASPLGTQCSPHLLSTSCCHFLMPATATAALWGQRAPGQWQAGSKGRARQDGGTCLCA